MSSYDDQESRFGLGGGGITHSVQRLILVNVSIFAAQLVLDVPLGDANPVDTPGGPQVVDWLAFSPIDVIGGFIWQPFTYMFLHSGLWHLFANMLMLFFFGPEVERTLGTRQFLRFYFVCGVGGVMANFSTLTVFSGAHAISVVGASGAVLGVLVAFAIVDPDRKVYLLPLPFPITSRGLVIIIVVMNLLTAAGGSVGTSVATHFGGMAIGYAYMKIRPRFTQWRLKRRSRPVGRDAKKMGDAVDNIFKFQGRDKK